MIGLNADVLTVAVGLGAVYGIDGGTGGFIVYGGLPTGCGFGPIVSLKRGNTEATGVGVGSSMFISLKKVSWTNSFDCMSRVCMS